MNDILRELGIIPAGADTNTDDINADNRPVREEFEMEQKSSNVPEIEDSDAKVDYEYARSAIYAIVQMNLSITHRAMTVAKETEHPRAIEAFNSASSNALNSVKELVNVQTSAKSIYKDAKVKPKEAPETEGGTTVNIAQTVAVNTSDLLKQVDEDIAREKAEAEGKLNEG